MYPRAEPYHPPRLPLPGSAPTGRAGRPASPRIPPPALGGGRRLRGRARFFRGGGRSAARGRAKETRAGGEGGWTLTKSGVTKKKKK